MGKHRPIQFNRCAEVIATGPRAGGQCPNRIWKDGYCKRHHPDFATQRRHASKAGREAQLEARRKAEEALDCLVEAEREVVAKAKRWRLGWAVRKGLDPDHWERLQKELSEAVWKLLDAQKVVDKRVPHNSRRK